MKKFIAFIAVGLVLGVFISLPKTSDAAVSVSGLEKQIKSLNGQLAAKNKQIASLNSQLAAKNKQISSLNSQISALSKQVATPSKSNFTYQSNTEKDSLITYQGNVYTKINTLGKFLGLGISYAKNNDTWYLGENSSGTMMSDILIDYSGYDDYANESPFPVAGINYTKGYSYYADDKQSYNFDYNLQGKYTTITGKLGFEDGSSTIDQLTGAISFYGDGKLLQTYKVINGELPIDANISVKGVHKLEVVTSLPSNSGSGNIDFVNPKIY